MITKNIYNSIISIMIESKKYLLGLKAKKAEIYEMIVTFLYDVPRVSPNEFKFMMDLQKSLEIKICPLILKGNGVFLSDKAKNIEPKQFVSFYYGNIVTNESSLNGHTFAIHNTLKNH